MNLEEALEILNDNFYMDREWRVVDVYGDEFLFPTDLDIHARPSDTDKPVIWIGKFEAIVIAMNMKLSNNKSSNEYIS